MTVSFDRLEYWATRVLVAAGASDMAAALTAESCVRANRRGLDSHGVVYLETYVRRLKAGVVDGMAEPEVVEARPSLALVDGHFAPGALVGAFAMDWSCEHAATNGVAAAVTRNSSHFGAASFFSERAARRGFIGMVLSNSDPGLGPEGALAPVLGTNPLAVAGPPADGVLPSLDIAASVAAQGRVGLAARRGEAIPSDWALGRDGRPTTDAAEALRNTMLPVGGYKGLGLAFVIDLLSGCLGGGLVSPQLLEERGASQLFVAFKVGAVGDPDDYSHRLRELVAAVHDAPRADWAAPFLVPGERETHTAHDRGSSMRFDDATVAVLRAVGADCGVPFPPGDEDRREREPVAR